MNNYNTAELRCSVCYDNDDYSEIYLPSTCCDDAPSVPTGNNYDITMTLSMSATTVVPLVCVTIAWWESMLESAFYFP